MASYRSRPPVMNISLFLKHTSSTPEWPVNVPTGFNVGVETLPSYLLVAGPDSKSKTSMRSPEAEANLKRLGAKRKA